MYIVSQQLCLQPSSKHDQHPWLLHKWLGYSRRRFVVCSTLHEWSDTGSYLIWAAIFANVSICGPRLCWVLTALLLEAAISVEVV